MPTITREYKYATGPIAKRLEFRTDRSGECWLWTGHLNHAGYGEIKVNGRRRLAHRVAYEELTGPIPAGLQLDHLCHTRDAACPGGDICQHRRCVNPAHLEPVTGRENNQRSTSLTAMNALKSHCKRGHVFNEANTYVNPAGSRVCRACHRIRQGRYKANRRAAR